MNANQILEERIKCAKSPVYFLNNYGFVFDAVEKRVKKMKCFEYQERCVDIFHKKQNSIILKSRQTGLSVITAGYVAWRLMFRYDERILIVANDGNGAERFLETVKQFIQNTPQWLQPDSIILNNKRKLVFSNGSWVQAKASSPDAGRGDSLTMLVLDETAFIKDAEAIWMAAGMALSATKGKCIMISTPNGTGNLYHKTWVGATKKENDFTTMTVHWTQNPQSAIGLERIKNASGEEVPWSPWYEEQCRRMNYDSVKIAQELDLSFEGSKYLVIEQILIDKYEKRTRGQKPNFYIRYDFTFKGMPQAGSFILDETSFHVWKRPEEGRHYIIGCLPPGEKVLTDGGLKNIEDVTQYDKLINDEGRYVDIINKQIYEVENEDVYDIKVDNTFRTTKFTKEHPILVSQNTKLKRSCNSISKKEGKRYWDFDFKYVRAEELQIGDWIKAPNIYKKELDFNINDKWSFIDSENVRLDFKIESPLNDKDFWWFVGLWLGDGWLGKNKHSYSVTICFNKKETYYLEKCATIIEKLFNRHPSIIERDATYDLTFNSKELYHFILENFGQYSYGKKISEWVKFISKDYKLELIKGYFDSDGCWIKVDKKNKTHSKISFVSINLELLESVQDMLFSIGIISSLNKLRNASMHIIRNKECNTKECYNLNLANFDSLKFVQLLNDSNDVKLNKFKISDFDNTNKRIVSSCHFDENEDFIYFKVKNIEKSKFTGNVYNFECDTHTFMCHHITTHNCDVARGDGKDYSTIQVFDAETLEQVAEYKDKVGVDLFPYLIDWVGRMYNTAYLVVECNTFGLAVALSLRDALKYPRMFYSKNIQDIHVRPYDYKVPEGVEIPGFQTTVRTRPLIIKSLIEHMRENSLILHSPRLTSEFGTFVMAGNKPQHEPGYNDDLIFATALALYIRDTEYNNVIATDSMYKSMLGAISFSTNSTVGKVDYTPKFPNKDINIPEGGSGIFLGNSFTQSGDDDLSWLLK